MSETVARANQTWGIYHSDREYAKALGDPLRTVVDAPSQIAAEEIAAHLGFGDARARPIRPEQVERAQWLPETRPGHRQELARTKRRGVRIGGNGS